jgi:nitric oxide reductase activation protein
LHNFCKGLDIPIAIYGHTEFDDVELYAYAEFDSIDNKDQYRLMDMSARCGNRDGAALRYVAERLMTRPEAVKLLIIISDGQPAANDYYGTEAEADLRGIKKEYTAKGIQLFAAAIGNDKPNIQRIYGNSFLDITNLEKLPMNLGRLIIQHVRQNFAS